jgi:hypothetical protein
MLAHPGTGGKEVLVERFSFSSEVAFVPRGDLLDRVTIAPLTPSLFEGSPMQAAIFRIKLLPVCFPRPTGPRPPQTADSGPLKGALTVFTSGA